MRRLVVATTLVAGLFVACVAHAADAWTIVHAGRLLDRPGQAARGPSTVAVKNGRLEAVRDGHLDPVAMGAPQGTPVLDLKDRFVLPGLIDCHVHLRSDRAGTAAQLDAVTRSVADVAYEAAVNARKTLLAGFTTVRNLGDGDGVTLALRDAVARGASPAPGSWTPAAPSRPARVTWIPRWATARSCTRRWPGTTISATGRRAAGGRCGCRSPVAWT